MNLKWRFIWNDLRVFACLACAVYQWGNNIFLRNFWLLLGVYFLVKQLYDHHTYYKATKKYY
jgi:hypothetical protein